MSELYQKKLISERDLHILPHYFCVERHSSRPWLDFLVCIQSSKSAGVRVKTFDTLRRYSLTEVGKDGQTKPTGVTVHYFYSYACTSYLYVVCHCKFMHSKYILHTDTLPVPVSAKCVWELPLHSMHVVSLTWCSFGLVAYMAKCLPGPHNCNHQGNIYKYPIPLIRQQFNATVGPKQQTIARYRAEHYVSCWKKRSGHTWKFWKPSLSREPSENVALI